VNKKVFSLDLKITKATARIEARERMRDLCGDIDECKLSGIIQDK